MKMGLIGYLLGSVVWHMLTALVSAIEDLQPLHDSVEQSVPTATGATDRTSVSSVMPLNGPTFVSADVLLTLVSTVIIVFGVAVLVVHIIESPVEDQFYGRSEEWRQRRGWGTNC